MQATIDTGRAQLAAQYRNMAYRSDLAGQAFTALGAALEELSQRSFDAYTALEDGTRPDTARYTSALAKVRTAVSEAEKYAGVFA